MRGEKKLNLDRDWEKGDGAKLDRRPPLSLPLMNQKTNLTGTYLPEQNREWCLKMPSQVDTNVPIINFGKPLDHPILIEPFHILFHSIQIFSAPDENYTSCKVRHLATRYLYMHYNWGHFIDTARRNAKNANSTRRNQISRNFSRSRFAISSLPISVFQAARDRSAIQPPDVILIKGVNNQLH